MAQVVWRLHPRALNPAPVLALPALFSSAGVGQAATGPGRRRAPGHGPITASRAGLGLGERLAPDAALGLVDLASQVQVETSEHAQRRGVLVRGANGSQGLWHGPGRAGDDGSVLRVGLGAARCQVGDASHRQSGQVAHGGAHVLSHRYGQGPWWWRADRPPPAGSRDRPASRRERAGAPRRWSGPCRGSSGPSRLRAVAQCSLLADARYR